MPPPLLLGLIAVAAYLVGSVPFGYLAARWRGVDILKQGSRNIGATNVSRVLGRGWGLLVFFLDLAKGALPVLAARHWSTGADIAPEAAGVSAGVAAFLGHLFPVFLGFRGGKGVATGAGIVLVLMPVPAALALAAWAIVVISSRYVSLASLLAAAVLLALRCCQSAAVWAWPQNLVTGFCLVAVGLIFVRHRTNIDRLLRGQENRLADSAALFLAGKTLHVLAVGLWFGMAVFFTFVVGLSLFHTFERLSVDPRPLWLPLPAEFAGEPPSPRFPDPLRKEQGSRLAGAAVGPLFAWYYSLQMACAVAAAATALSWSMARRAETVHHFRTVVFMLALATVGGGWWLEHVVVELRIERNEATDAVLASRQPRAGALARAEAARAEFGRWHFASLMVNFATVLLVTLGMALTAQLPAWQLAPAESRAGADCEPTPNA